MIKKRMFIVVLGLGLSIASSGCAFLKMSSDDSRRAESIPLIEASSLKDAEKRVANVQSEQVVLSTRSLREMLRKERARAQRCEALSGQLKALKSIDVEEIQ